MSHRRRRKTTRTRRASSADIRFTLVMVVLAAIVLALGSLLVSQARGGDWKGAAVSGGVVIVLLAIGAYSVVQKRRL
jgi:hypothetical protein